MAGYRLRVTYTYNTTANATTAQTNLNNVLAAHPEITGGPCTRNGTSVDLDAVVPDALAVNNTFRRDITVAYSVGTRASGKYSLSRIGDT